MRLSTDGIRDRRRQRFAARGIARWREIDLDQDRIPATDIFA